MGKDVIVACDFASKAQTLEFLDRFTAKILICDHFTFGDMCRSKRTCAADRTEIYRMIPLDRLTDSL